MTDSAGPPLPFPPPHTEAPSCSCDTCRQWRAWERGVEFGFMCGLGSARDDVPPWMRRVFGWWRQAKERVRR